MDIQQTGQLLAEDAHNVVLDYCADGLEAFHSCVSTALANREESQAGTSGTGANGGLLTALGEGTQRLYNRLAGTVGASMQLFEQVCATCVFKPPIRVSIPQLEPVKLPEEAGCSISIGGESMESEEALVAKIASMRKELAQVDQRCAALRQEAQRVDKHIVSCGDTSDYMAIAATAQSHKHTILAIAQAAENLQNMMEKAARLRAAGQQTWAGAADKKLEPQEAISNAAGTTLAAVNALSALVRA